MKFLKGLASGLLSLLLFLSLTIFGIAFLLNQTILNPNFITSEVDKLDVSSLAEESISKQASKEKFPEEMETALINTITEVESPVKEQLGAAIDETYDYLLGKRGKPDLATTLDNTFLNSAFVTTLMEKVDLSLLVEETISEGVSKGDFPKEFGTAMVNAIDDLEPMIKERISAAADPIFDYLLGKRQDIDLALILRNDVFTSDFVLSLMDEFAASSLASEFLSEEFAEQIPEETEFLVDQLDDIIADLAPAIEEQISTAADPLLDYILGQRPSINVVISLASVKESLEDSLREHVLELPPAAVVPYLQELLTEQIAETLPAGMEDMVDSAVTEEWIEEQANLTVSPVLNYLLGKSQDLNVVISLEPLVEELREPIKEEFMESPPSELAGLPQSQLEQHFDDYFQELAGEIPPTIVIDESLLGADLPAQVDDFFRELAKAIPPTFDFGDWLETAMPVDKITDGIASAEEKLGEARQNINEALADAETMLEQGRQFVSYFQIGYMALIGLILLLVLGIIFLNRQVRSATRKLGTIFLTYGALWFAGILVAKHFIGTQLEFPDMPKLLQTWIPQLISDFIAPLQMFSLGLLIGGVALIIVSFVYKPRQQPAEITPPQNIT